MPDGEKDELLEGNWPKPTRKRCASCDKRHVGWTSDAVINRSGLVSPGGMRRSSPREGKSDSIFNTCWVRTCHKSSAGVQGRGTICRDFEIPFLPLGPVPSQIPPQVLYRENIDGELQCRYRFYTLARLSKHARKTDRGFPAQVTATKYATCVE